MITVDQVQSYLGKAPYIQNIQKTEDLKNLIHPRFFLRSLK